MSIGTAVRVLVRKSTKKFTGAEAADVNEYVKMYLGLLIQDTKADEADVAVLADAQLLEEADNGAQWAINLRDSNLLNVVKPIVDKANAKGIDPVTALVLADFAEEQAREYVTALEERETAPSIPAQSNEGDDQSDEDDEDEDSFDPAVTVSH